jgi:hypothetical protein
VPPQTESSEAIPSVGRYDSYDVAVQQQQLWWFTRSGIDLLGSDWTNNL